MTVEVLINYIILHEKYTARTMTTFLLSQILAAIAFVCGIVAFQCKRRRSILLWLFGSTIINAGHFFVLGRPGPGTLLLVLCVRALAAAFSTNRKLMYLFLIIVLMGFLFSYKDPLDLLALLAALLATCASFQKTVRKVRLMYVMCAATWIIHNILVGTPVAVLMEATFLTSNVAGYWRFHRRHKTGPSQDLDLTEERTG